MQLAFMRLSNKLIKRRKKNKVQKCTEASLSKNFKEISTLILQLRNAKQDLNKIY